MSNAKPANRRKARQLLVQALYSWLITGSDLIDIETHFYMENDMKEVDRDYFKELLYAVPKQRSTLEATFQPYLDRTVEELDPISKAILCLSTYELTERPDVPYKVVINEGVNLAKMFGPTDAYKFINGVLDQVAASTRAVEVAAQRR